MLSPLSITIRQFILVFLSSTHPKESGFADTNAVGGESPRKPRRGVSERRRRGVADDTEASVLRHAAFCDSG